MTIASPRRGGTTGCLLALTGIAERAAHLAREPGVVELTPCGLERVTTWGELDADVRAIAATINGTVAPDRCVMLALPNGAEFVAALLGVMAAGRRVFPIHPLTPAEEVRRLAGLSDAAFIVIETEGADPGVPTRTVRDLLGTRTRIALPGEACLILNSSGTTGLPKIVLRNARSLDAVTGNVRRAVGITPGDVVLGAVPMFHSYGIENVVLAPMAGGARIVCVPGLDPATIGRAIAEHVVTVLPSVPAMIEGLAHRAPAKRSTLRCIYSAGSSLPIGVARAFERSWGLRVGQLYGATELGSLTFACPTDPNVYSMGVGTPMGGVEVRVVSIDSGRECARGEEGHVHVCAPSMLERYLDEPGPTLHGTMLPTGDLGYITEAGHVHITGRIKLLIDVGGIKVNPIEIEQVVKGLGGVLDCAVVPMRVSATTERLRLIIEDAPGRAPISDEDVRAALRSRFAPHKLPRVIERRASLPRSATGKLLRTKL